MKFIISVLFLLFSMMILTGCTTTLDAETEKFVGTWIGQNNKLIFSEKGIVSIEYWTGTYEIQNGTNQSLNSLYITYNTDDGNVEEIYFYEFSEDNTKLTLTDHRTSTIIEYVKQ
jgi:hypothetical protein